MFEGKDSILSCVVPFAGFQGFSIADLVEASLKVEVLLFPSIPGPSNPFDS